MAELYPDYFARFYDLIYHQMRDDDDNEFYIDMIGRAGGKILEVGVGTGRLFMKALKDNADIYGIDISPAMLEVLSKKLTREQNSRISLQNIVDFKSDNSFDLIIAPFRVFMHLTGRDDQLKALNNVYDHLNENGKFIFDVFVPDLNQLIKGIDHVTDFEGEYEPGRKVKRTVTTKPDLINQIINIVFLLEWDDDDGYKRKEWNTSLRFFFRYELEHLIERSEFNKYHISGDFKESELKPDSREFIITCTK